MVFTQKLKQKVISPIFKLKIIFFLNTHAHTTDDLEDSPKISSQQKFECFAASTSNSDMPSISLVWSNMREQSFRLVQHKTFSLLCFSQR